MLLCGIACMILSLAVLIQYQREQTDGWTMDTQANGHKTMANRVLAYHRSHGKNCRFQSLRAMVVRHTHAKDQGQWSSLS